VVGIFTGYQKYARDGRGCTGDTHAEVFQSDLARVSSCLSCLVQGNGVLANPADTGRQRLIEGSEVPAIPHPNLKLHEVTDLIRWRGWAEWTDGEGENRPYAENDREDQ
jgi:hypothetical protein